MTRHEGPRREATANLRLPPRRANCFADNPDLRRQLAETEP